MKIVVVIAGLLSLGACAPIPPEPVPVPSSGAGQCPVARYQSYVGRQRSSLPAQPPGETWRVACTTCGVTMDYNPSRVNFFYNERTNIIEQVRCG